jgi:hypothetical protein
MKKENQTWTSHILMAMISEVTREKRLRRDLVLWPQETTRHQQSFTFTPAPDGFRIRASQVIANNSPKTINEVLHTASATKPINIVARISSGMVA